LIVFFVVFSDVDIDGIVLSQHLSNPLRQQQQQQRKSLMLSYAHTQRALITHRYKLYRMTQIDVNLLFDIENDDYELNDLSENIDNKALSVL
jgi:TRAP-type uncharacterized transport system substrate-binding protein